MQSVISFIQYCICYLHCFQYSIYHSFTRHFQFLPWQTFWKSTANEHSLSSLIQCKSTQRTSAFCNYKQMTQYLQRGSHCSSDNNTYNLRLNVLKFGNISHLPPCIIISCKGVYKYTHHWGQYCDLFVTVISEDHEPSCCNWISVQCFGSLADSRTSWKYLQQQEKENKLWNRYSTEHLKLLCQC
jgi:hypothetical protein